MIELIGCILLSIIGITFIVMLIDELRTNYKMRKWKKTKNDIEINISFNVNKNKLLSKNSR